MAERADVVVIGGGVVGVSAAHALAERGIRAQLLERGEICSGCSHGNAGWVFPSHALPIPGPGVLRQALGWLLDPDGPLYIRPRASLSLARWLWSFLGACNRAAERRAFALRRELSLASLVRYRELAELPGLEFDFEQRGILLVCRSRAELAEAEREIGILREFGGEARRLDANELRERVPACAEDLAGGVHFSADAHLTPQRFVHGLASEAQRLGVRLRTGTEVLRLERSGARLRLATTRGEIEAEQVVVATGAWSPELAGQLGLRVPVEGAKGYSVTRERPTDFPEQPLLLAEAKVAITPMGRTLRFGGTLELAGRDLGVSWRRLRAILRAVSEYLPGLPETPTLEIWRGLRPLTPDDLPIIGRSRRQPGVVLATGHGMNGLAQGPITGQLVAQLVAGEPTSLDLGPFSPDRF
ncbi:MAG: FAD-dependent oxidoreductase [Proteobacteria bacterium]|nr:FAD-dependent oxidoreductase [Pseudomonadota bacterium]